MKLKYPTFSGDILSYQELKRRWLEDVVPERKLQALELAALRESIPNVVRNNITEVNTVKEAWNLMDIHYSDRR